MIFAFAIFENYTKGCFIDLRKQIKKLIKIKKGLLGCCVCSDTVEDLMVRFCSFGGVRMTRSFKVVAVFPFFRAFAHRGMPVSITSAS